MRAASFRRSLLGRTYPIPLAIGVVSIAGLLFALIGDGVWDWLSWLALGLPVAIGIGFAINRNRRARHYRAM